MTHIKYWERDLIKKIIKDPVQNFVNIQWSGIYDQDVKKRCIIYHEDVHYVKKSGMELIGIPNEYSTDNEYFDMIEYLFDSILDTHHNVGVIMKKSAKIYLFKNELCNIKKCNNQNNKIYFTET